MRTEYLLDREVEQVLALLMPANRLVMRVCLHTGLRVGDVLALKPDQLKSHCWVREQKTGKARQIGLPEPLLTDLKEQCGKYWVFAGTDPRKHRTRQAVWRDVKRATAALRMDKNAGTHSARKVYAVDLMHKYGDIDKVRRALNHESAEVTAIYAMADLMLNQRGKRRRAKAGRKKA